MDTERHWFEKFTLYMEQNIRSVQIGIYTVGVIGLAVAVRSVRPFSRFVRPQDIPSSFVERHVTLHGKVLRIESVGSGTPLLMVEHRPVVSLFKKPSPGLPVHIAGVDVSGNGIAWMQTVMVGEDVRFIPLRISLSSVSSIVHAQCGDVGMNLVSLGFGTVASLDFELEKDPLYMKYYKKLLKAEQRAEKEGQGMWLNESNLSQRIWRKVVV